MLFKTIHSRKLAINFEMNFILTDFYNSKSNAVM